MLIINNARYYQLVNTCQLIYFDNEQLAEQVTTAYDVYDQLPEHVTGYFVYDQLPGQVRLCCV